MRSSPSRPRCAATWPSACPTTWCPPPWSCSTRCRSRPTARSTARLCPRRTSRRRPLTAKRRRRTSTHWRPCSRRRWGCRVSASMTISLHWADTRCWRRGWSAGSAQRCKSTCRCTHCSRRLAWRSWPRTWMRPIRRPTGHRSWAPRRGPIRIRCPCRSPSSGCGSCTGSKARARRTTSRRAGGCTATSTARPSKPRWRTSPAGTRACARCFPRRPADPASRFSMEPPPGPRWNACAWTTGPIPRPRCRTRCAMPSSPASTSLRNCRCARRCSRSAPMTMCCCSCCTTSPPMANPSRR